MAFGTIGQRKHPWVLSGDPLALAGARLTSIMRQTWHKSVDVAKTYVRDAALWRDNVSALVL
jgi:hypothetical protein